jgi:hypothetical protein
MSMVGSPGEQPGPLWGVFDHRDVPITSADLPLAAEGLDLIGNPSAR